MDVYERTNNRKPKKKKKEKIDCDQLVPPRELFIYVYSQSIHTAYVQSNLFFRRFTAESLSLRASLRILIKKGLRGAKSHEKKKRVEITVTVNRRAFLHGVNADADAYRR